MLQIRLKGPSSEGGGGTKHLTVDNVTVACPDHLVLADLPVAKRLGSATTASLVKTVGRRSRRQLGERVHFCVRCDFPIAIYGRLSPCEHAFCLDCARSDSICYLCDERIQKIQTIKMMEGIFVCAAPHCLKSFLKKTEFEYHIHKTHADLLQPKAEKEDGNESEVFSTKQSTASESTARAPPRPIFSPNSNSQVHDPEDKAHRLQPRDQPPPPRPMIQLMPPPPLFGQIQNHPSEIQTENNRPQGFDRPGSHNNFFQPSFTSGISETPFPGYSNIHAHHPPNFAVPLNSNSVLAAPPFNYPPFTPDLAPPFHGTPPYEMPRPDSALDVGSEQGSLLGFPPGPAGMNFSDGYPRPWNVGPAGAPFEHSPGGQGVSDGFVNVSDSQGRVAFFPGDFGRNSGVLPSNMSHPTSTNKGMEAMQGGNSVDPRDGKGILAAQPFPPLPPPRLPGPHMSQLNRGYSGDMGRDGQSFAWQHERRDSFGSGQDQ